VTLLHSLRPELDLHRIDRRPRPLPGAADSDVAADALQRRRPDLPPPLARRLAQTYGTLAEEAVDAGALDPLAQDVLETEAEVLYARDREWAMTTEDVLRRRTTLALTGRGTPAVRDRVAALLRS